MDRISYPPNRDRVTIRRVNENGTLGEAVRVPFDMVEGWWQKRSEGYGAVYRTADDRYFQVDVIDGPVARFSAPRPYLANRPDGMKFRVNSTASDGRLVAWVERAEEEPEEPQTPGIEVVLNWTELLKRELGEPESTNR